MRDNDRIREEKTHTLNPRTVKAWWTFFLMAAVGMFIAGFFVGKEYSTWAVKQFTVNDAKDADAVARQQKAERIEEAFIKNYEPSLETKGQKDVLKDRKLEALLKRAKGEDEKIEAIKPRPTQPAKPAPAPEPIARTGDKAPPSAFDEATFSLQVTAVKSEENAMSELNGLRNKGYDSAYVLEAHPWYRIRLGRFATREQMEAFRAYFLEQENRTLFPVRIGDQAAK